MNTKLTRKEFIRTNLGILTTGLLVIPQVAKALHPDQEKRPDPLKPEMVENFVRKAHGDFAATQELLAETPTLLNATWDWGNGDFETAIGGAGHMGRRDIAEFLISKGARMDIFIAAMLGKTDVVKSMIAAYPDMLHSKGPHGIPLLVHAQKGGDQAKEVLDYLTVMLKK